MKLYIQSNSRYDKSIIIESKKVKEVFKVESDILQELQQVLSFKKLKLQDFDDFVAIPSESFTGYRQAVNITNTLKHYVSKIPLKSLLFPKYHKEPNVRL
jgi:hypothetical protein